MRRKVPLNKILFIAVLLGTTLSCELSDDTDCGDSLIIEDSELFVSTTSALNSTLEFGSSPDVVEFTSCDPFPISFNGYEGIYLVSGTLQIGCEGDACMDVVSVSLPFCPVEIEIDNTSQYSLFGPWKYAYLAQENDTIHPPCRDQNLTFTIRRDVINQADFPHYISTTYGNSSLEADFRLSVGTLLTKFLSINNGNAPPYTSIVQDSVFQFFNENDTLIYDLEFNEMELRGTDQTRVMKWYQ